MTRCDLLEKEELLARQKEIEKTFGAKPIITSSLTSSGVNELKDTIERQVVSLSENSVQAAERIAINQRHRQVIETAIKNLDRAEDTIKHRADEVATMLLRNAWQALGSVETEQLDETVLDRIFSNFCIGK
jgi:tRNA modification GTPase